MKSGNDIAAYFRATLLTQTERIEFDSRAARAINLYDEHVASFIDTRKQTIAKGMNGLHSLYQGAPESAKHYVHDDEKKLRDKANKECHEACEEEKANLTSALSALLGVILGATQS